jgi:hypothetical protein
MSNINLLYAIRFVSKFTLFIVTIFEIYILIGKNIPLIRLVTYDSWKRLKNMYMIICPVTEIPWGDQRVTGSRRSSGLLTPNYMTL